MTGLGAPAREATKLVAGFMHFLADCLEETAGVDGKPAGPTVHIEHAVFQAGADPATVAADVQRAAARAAAQVDQAQRRQAATRDKLERTKRRRQGRGLVDALVDAFRPDHGPGDQADYALAARK